MDSAIDERFLNVTPLHRAELYIQGELKKLQASVRDLQNKSEARNSDFCLDQLLKTVSARLSGLLLRVEGF